MADNQRPNDPGSMLWRSANAWLRCAGAALRPIELSFVQYLLLDGLAAGDGSPATQIGLARRVGCDPMTTSQVLRGLERRRLVRRQRDRDDPRAWAVTLSPNGEAVLARARPLVDEAVDSFFAGLGGEQPAFTAALGRMIGIKARVRVAVR